MFKLDPPRPAATQRVTVRQIDEKAIASRLIVAGQIFNNVRALIVRFQIAKLPLPLQAALAKDARSNGGVHVGSDIEVIRQREFETAAAGAAEGGGEEPVFALIAERKVDPRGVKNGDSFEFDAGVLGRGGLGLMVDFQFAGTQEPVIDAIGAGCVARTLQALFGWPFK